MPGLIEESDDETENDDTDDEDTELVEPMGIKQVNANGCDVTGTADGPEQNNNTDNQGDMHIFTIEDTDDYDDYWYIDLETNGSDVHYKIDTGTQANVLTLNVYRCLLKKPKLHKSNAKLTAYNGTTIKVLDKCIVSIPFKGKRFPVLFIVADTKSTQILGLGTCKRIHLVQRMYQVDSTPAFLEEFEDCFG